MVVIAEDCFYLNHPHLKRTREPHTSRNCFSSPLTVHSLTTAFISPEGESLLRSLRWETNDEIQLSFPGLWLKLDSISTQEKNSTLHTLLWLQYSFQKYQSRPPTYHHGRLCIVCRIWHSHFSPDPAGSTLQAWIQKVYESNKNGNIFDVTDVRGTCVYVAVFASILRGDDRSHVCSA